MTCRSLLATPFLFLSILASAADGPAAKGLAEHLVAAGNGELGLDC